MAVDAAGWAEVAEVFRAAANRLEKIHELNRRRMAQSAEEATSLVVGMAAFEPAPQDWTPDLQVPEIGDAATNGGAPAADDRSDAAPDPGDAGEGGTGASSA